MDENLANGARTREQPAVRSGEGTGRERQSVSDESGTPSGEKSEDRDDWSRTLDSLASEFVETTSLGEKKTKPAPESTARSGEPSLDSGARALLATQDLRLEVDRLRDELEDREEALKMFERLNLDASEILGDPSGNESRAQQTRVAELERSLESAKMHSSTQAAAVEDLRSQLNAAQEQLKAALGALASQIPSVSEEEAAERSATVETVRPSLSESPSPGTVAEGRRVIRRSAHRAGGGSLGQELLAPVEILGPGGELVGSVLFACGEGEALELFLSTLFQQWKGLGRSYEVRLAADGLHLNLVDDPENRRMSVLASGAYVIHLGAPETSLLRSLLSARQGPPKGGP